MEQLLQYFKFCIEAWPFVYPINIAAVVLNIIVIIDNKDWWLTYVALALCVIFIIGTIIIFYNRKL